MAFNEQNREDAYKFFVLTFNAVPGSKHAVDIVNAYNAGLNTQEIIEIYTSKAAFKATYPDTQTPQQFAETLVANVAAASASAAAKNAAVADIVKAMAGGMTKGGVIFQVLGNLTNLDVADPNWGTTVAQLNNKVAVAKALTEGANAIDTTDVALLQAPMKLVTADVASVAKAMAAASGVSGLLKNLADANKASSDYAKSLDIYPVGTAAKDKTLVQAKSVLETATTGLIDVAEAAADAATGAANTAAPGTTVVDVQVTDTLAILASKSNTFNLEHATALKTAQTKVTTDKAALIPSDKAIYATSAAATAADLAAKQSVTSATAAVENAKGAFLAPKSGVLALDNSNTAATVTVKFTPTDAAAVDLIVLTTVAVAYTPASAGPPATPATPATAGVYGLSAGVTEEKYPGVTALLAAYNALAKANAIASDAAGALAEATTANTGPVTALLAAEKVVTDLQKAKTDFDKAVSDLVKYKGIQDSIKTLEASVKSAQDAFTAVGYAIPKDVATGLVATAENDTFIVNVDAATAGSISAFGLLGKDSIYVGQGYTKNESGDLTKGDNSKLEVFFKSNGLSTDVYIEQAAFGSSDTGAAAGSANIVKVTLTGVTADKLALSADGFITLA